MSLQKLFRSNSAAFYVPTLARVIVVGAIVQFIASACSEMPTAARQMRTPTSVSKDGVVNTPVLTYDNNYNNVFIYPSPVVFTGVADPGAVCTVFDNGVAVGEFTADQNGQFAAQLALPVGNHIINSSCANGGNTSGLSNDLNLAVLPPVNVNYPPTDLVGGGQIFLGGTTAPGAQCTIADNNTDIAGVTADATGAFGTTVTLDPGMHNLVITCSLNGVSNQSAATITVAPPLYFSVPSPTVTYPAPITFTGTTSPGAVCNVYGAGVQTDVTADASGNFSGSLALPVGSTTIFARCVMNGAGSVQFPVSVTVLPAQSPVDALKSALVTSITSLNLPPAISSRLLTYVNQLPSTIAGLTRTQKALDIQIAQSLIRVVTSLSPMYIPASSAAQIVILTNQLIAALST